MKKSRKKILLSSIAMLLVALVALGSATFAWFSVSKSVYAQNINVKAISTAGLEISKVADSGYDTIANFNGTSFNIKPVSWQAAYASSAFTNSGFVPDGTIDAPGGAFTGTSWTNTGDKPAVTTAASTKGFFATYKVWVRSASDGTARPSHTVDASVTIGGTNEGFARAYLVDLTTTTNSKVYADTATAFNSRTATDGTTASTTPLATTTFTHVTATDAVATAKTSDVGKPYLLVIWFDGDDADCDDNGMNQTADFTVEFKATDI